MRHGSVSALEPEAVALRTAPKNADRDVVLQPDSDDQASVYLQGPAVPLTRWYDTVDRRARAFEQAGDPRTLAQLRLDLATSFFPCATHPPVDPTRAPSGPGAPRAARRRGCARATWRPSPPTAA